MPSRLARQAPGEGRIYRRRARERRIRGPGVWSPAYLAAGVSVAAPADRFRGDQGWRSTCTFSGPGECTGS
jgi:hypothetical protein